MTLGPFRRTSPVISVHLTNRTYGQPNQRIQSYLQAVSQRASEPNLQRIPYRCGRYLYSFSQMTQPQIETCVFCSHAINSREPNCSSAKFGGGTIRLFYNQLYIAKQVFYKCTSVNHTKRKGSSQIKARTLRMSRFVFLAFPCRNLVVGVRH